MASNTTVSVSDTSGATDTYSSDRESTITISESDYSDGTSSTEVIEALSNTSSSFGCSVTDGRISPSPTCTSSSSIQVLASVKARPSGPSRTVTKDAKLIGKPVQDIKPQDTKGANPFKKLCELEKGQIIGFRSLGWSQKKIGDFLGVSQVSISRHLSKMKNEMDRMLQEKNPSMPSTTTPKEDRGGPNGSTGNKRKLQQKTDVDV